MPAETTVSTPLNGTNPEAVIAALHNHEQYIKITCPQLISYKHISGHPDMGVPCLYEVNDKRPIGQTTFKLTLVNQNDGIDALVEGKAPTGALTIQSKWTVAGDKLNEAIVIDSNMLMKKMIKSNVDKSHPEQHQGFIIEANKA